jgi:hypothetical protein
MDRETEETVHVLACAACPRVSTVTARGWKAFWIEDPEDDEDVLSLTFFCPACAEA